MVTRKILTLLIVLSLRFTDVYGCECIPFRPFEEQYKMADIVFLAEVIEIADDQDVGFKNTLYYHIDSLYTDIGGYRPKFKVLNVYRGEFNEPIVDGEYQYKSSWSLCDVFFQRDKTYIVFGYFDENGYLTTNICTMTNIMNDEILKKLNSQKE